MGAIDDYFKKKREAEAAKALLKEQEVEKVTSEWLRRNREIELKMTNGKEAPKLNVMGGSGERGG